MAIKVVIMDDEEVALQRMNILLQKFPEVNVAVSSTKADVVEQALLKHHIDLAFIDVEMPEQSGFDMSPRIHQISPETKIIFTTAHEHYAIKAIRHNAFDYLLKPIDIDELGAAINRYKVQHQSNLSQREFEIIGLLAKGLSSKEIGEKLFLSHHTIDTHRRKILQKTGCKNSTELMNFISKQGTL